MTSTGATGEWTVALSTLFLLKQEIERRESPSLIGYTAAKVRASSADIDDAQERLGALPESLLGWFQHVNGWPEIYFELAMLPLGDVQTADVVARGDGTLSAYLSAVEHPGAPEAMLVVGSTPESANRILVHKLDGTTIWLDRDDTQRFATMYDFIQAVIGMHRVYLDKHAGR